MLKPTRFLVSISKKSFPYIHLNYFFKNKLSKYILCILLLPISLLSYLWFNIICLFVRENMLKYDLAIVAIVKNEAAYIREWIEYYRLNKIDKIILYDNESTDNIKEVIKDYIEDNLVDYRVIKGKKRQLDAYNDALWRYYKKCRYIAFIDADEFIVSKNNDIKDDIEKTFEISNKVGGIAVNWLIYGSSGHKTKPEGLVIENYLYRSDVEFEKNKHIKSVVNPRKIICYRNPHVPDYRARYTAINCAGDIVKGAFSDYVDISKLHINHYFTKSLEEFEKKRNRGKADADGIRDISDFELHNRNEIYDDKMLPYAKKIKDKLITND